MNGVDLVNPLCEVAPLLETSRIRARCGAASFSLVTINSNKRERYAPLQSGVVVFVYVHIYFQKLPI